MSNKKKKKQTLIIAEFKWLFGDNQRFLVIRWLLGLCDLGLS